MKDFGFLIAINVICMSLLISCNGGERDFDACGQVEATEVIVSAENNGKILRLAINEGDVLEKSQTVGCIDSMPVYLQKRELEERKLSLASKVIDIDRQLAPQIANLANLKKDYERYSTLLVKDAATQKQVDDIETQIKVTERNIDAQKQTYEKNNANINKEIDVFSVQIEQKNDLLAKCRICSPINGTVMTKYAEEGEMVTTGKPIFKIADMDDVYVRVYFTTRQLSDVKLGDTVDVIVEDGTDNPRHYEGKIRWISDEAEFTPKNIQTKDEQADMVYASKIALRNDGFVRIGMYAYVVLKSEK